MKEKILLGCVLFILCTISITEIFKVKIRNDKYEVFTPLSGAEYKTEYKKLNTKIWFNGEFTENLEKYIRENFVWRNVFIRIKNEIDYKIFKQINDKYIIEGKDDYLFTYEYIKSYTGEDLENRIYYEQKINKLKNIQDSLLKINKYLFLCLAPSKVEFFKEYVPSKFKASENRNYYIIKQICDMKNVQYIDGFSLFNEWKKKEKYPLYTKLGIHWSQYGAFLFNDTLIKFIENNTKWDLLNLELKNLELTQNSSYIDRDLEVAMNIISKRKLETLAYPKYDFTENYEKVKHPNLLIIGDSYTWNLYNFYFKTIFNNPKFWYYNSKQHDINNNEIPISELNKKNIINESDIILLLFTESNYKSLDYGFLDNF